MVISNYFSKAAASLPEQSGSDKASIYLHTLKVECPVSSEGSFLREAIQKVLVKMITADPTIRFSTVTDQHVDPNGIPKDNSVFNDRFNVKTNGNRRKATISAFFKAHSAKTLYELKKELWTFLTKHGIYLQNSVKATTKEELMALGFVQFVDPKTESLAGIRKMLVDTLEIPELDIYVGRDRVSYDTFPTTPNGRLDLDKRRRSTSCCAVVFAPTAKATHHRDSILKATHLYSQPEPD